MPLKRLQILQNRALRMILQEDSRSSRSFFKYRLYRLFECKIKKYLAILMFKLLNELFPIVLRSKIEVKQTHHSLRNIKRIILHANLTL